MNYKIYWILHVSLILFIFSSGTDAQQGIQGPHNTGEHGLLYGEVGESIEFQTIQNPYYDSDIKISELPERVYPDANDIDAVTGTKNIYYDILNICKKAKKEMISQLINIRNIIIRTLICLNTFNVVKNLLYMLLPRYE